MCVLVKKVKLELGWGNPDFLVPYWEAQGLSINIDLDQSLAYQFTGQEELKNNIKKLHQRIRNANIENKNIVIGQGATHLLNGLIAIHSSPLVYANSPCYHKFYDYVRLANKTWTCHKNSIEIVTRPNNPDGLKHDPVADFKIYDLSYNWPTYGQIDCYNEDVMVFGLSKATGHASARIGWAIIKDEKLAKDLETWIHLTSCGIGYYDQLVASKIIKHQVFTKHTVFEFGEKILMIDGRILF